MKMNSREFEELRSDLKEAFLKSTLLTSAKLMPNGHISATQSVKSPVEGKAISTSTSFYLDQENKKILPLGNTNMLNGDVLASSYSPSSSKQAILRKIDDTSLYLEIWENGVISHQVKVEKKHKDFCSNPFLCHFPIEWSNDESKVLYIAEKMPVPVDIWKEIESDEEEGEDDGEKKIFNADDFLSKNDYKNNWGESAYKWFNLEVFVYDLETEKFGKVKGIPKDNKVSYAQFLGKEGNGIVFCGMKGDLELPGLQLCMNKPADIFTIEKYELDFVLEKKKDKKKEPKKSQENEEKMEEIEKKEEEKSIDLTTKISEESDAIACFPIPSPSGNKICYIYTKTWNDNHLFATGLKVWNKESNSVEILVEDEEKNGELAMYISNGLYSDKVSWSADEKTLLLPSQEKAGVILNLFNFDTKERKKYRLSFDFDADDVHIFDFSQNSKGILLGLNNFYKRRRLVYLEDYTKCFEDPPTPNFVQEDFPKIDHPAQLDENSLLEEKVINDDITGYLWRLKTTDPLTSPTLVRLHGGPHYYTGSTSYEALNILLKKGHSVLTVNFSGSWSFGKDFNDRLAGNMGDLDLKEVVAVIEKLQEEKKIGETLDLFGWSYSGYQAVAFLQQYPKLFRKMLIGNPVTNLFYMLYASDIPDWVYHEGLGVPNRFDFTQDLTDEEFLKLKKYSPALQPFDPDCKTRVLLLMGDADLRVAPRATYYWYKKLKGLGYDITCKMYKGQNHGIRKVDFTFEYMLSILKLYLEK